MISSQSLEAEELEGGQGDVGPHQEESRLGDVAQAPHHHLHYIIKTPTGVKILKVTYFLPSGAVSDCSCCTLSAAKTISQGAMW